MTPNQANTTVSELLPCPFCGDKAISGTTLDDFGYVVCVSEKCWGMAGYLPSEAEAITAWNRRATADVTEAMVERVARAIDPDKFEFWQSSYDYQISNGADADKAKAFADYWHKLEPIYDQARAAIDALGSLTGARAALQGAEIALCDWLSTYAPDMCDPARVKEAEGRVHQRGTIAYIAEALAPIRAALNQAPE